MTSFARLLLAACLVGASVAIAMIGGDAIPLWVIGICSKDCKVSCRTMAM